jgi:hypothetical protein
MLIVFEGESFEMLISIDKKRNILNNLEGVLFKELQ